MTKWTCSAGTNWRSRERIIVAAANTFHFQSSSVKKT